MNAPALTVEQVEAWRAAFQANIDTGEMHPDALTLCDAASAYIAREREYQELLMRVADYEVVCSVIRTSFDMPNRKWFDKTAKHAAMKAMELHALSERGGEAVAWQNINKPDDIFTDEQLDPMWKVEFRPLFTRPQAGQEKIQPHHIAAVERAILDNEAQANRLIDQRDYSAEIPLDDAKSLREVLAMLAVQGGSHG